MLVNSKVCKSFKYYYIKPKIKAKVIMKQTYTATAQ